MKKNFKYALLSAIALIGAVSFSACQSSDEIVDNPNYNPETNSVKTQFTISLPNGLNKTTRQTSEVAQESGFRGIENIKLIPYSLESGDVQSTSTANDNLTELGAIAAFDYASSNSKVYADVEFQTGTSNFLFYGKAVDNTENTAITAASDMFKYGNLTVTGLAGTPTLSSVEFTPVAIYETGNDAEQTAITAGKAVGANLIAALNAVADAVPASALSDQSIPKFKEVTAAQQSTINDLFTSFSALTTASSHSVETVFFKLYKALDVLAATATTTDGNKLATAIRTAIKTYCNVTESEGNTTAVTLKTEYTGYPASVNLPDGAVRVAYSGGQFVAATSMAYASTYNVTALNHYVFPANLQYFVNSPIKVSNAVKSPQYSTLTWENILSTLYTDGTSVTGNTRSVAITNPVQYGVGRLDASVAQLDNTKTYYDWNGDAITVTAGYTLTGILIGGQKSVGWDYAVKGSTDYTIYDKDLATTSANWTVTTSAGTATNYTLVLETVAGDDEGTVNVALEFTNNGAEFAGLGGEIIPAGGRFYIVGQLIPSKGTVYNSAVKGKDRVFTQDHKTVVTFTINPGSNDDNNDNYRKGLATATNGLPDLRSSKLELGLSVDLTWESGLTFSVGI